MRKVICIISIILLVLVAQAAFAYSSLGGATGTANLPTAEIPRNGLNISYSSQTVTGLAVEDGFLFPIVNTTEVNAQVWRASYGIGGKLEISADYIGSYRTTKGLGVKYLLNANETNSNAVGFVYNSTSALTMPYMPPPIPIPGPYVANLKSPAPIVTATRSPKLFNRVNSAQIYFAHTQTIVAEGYKRPALIGTIGMNYTDESFTEGVGRAFGSLQLRYMNNVLAIDYQTLNRALENQAMKSVVLRREFKSGAGLEVGWTNTLDTLGDREDRFFFGGSFALGAK